MCGIAGIISKQPGSISIGSLESMAAALAHRGPDGQRCWISESGMAGFAHRRLAIIDLSPKAAQPMHYNDRYSIVYNGELYNYIELRTSLEAKGFAFATHSDTEVILAAYACHGQDCLQYFDGMFAFAIWDEMEHCLFAARDRFGEKPFYYCLEEDRLLFASEMKGLWAAGLPAKQNKRMLYNFLTLGYSQNPADPGETFYSNIHKLPARHFLLYRAASSELKESCYWDIKPETLISITEKEANDRFIDLFRTSVSRRLRSDVPIGTSLSGGLDSSSVLATCAGGSSFNHIAFSCSFPGYVLDETAYAATAARQFNSKLETVCPTVFDLLHQFDKLIYHQEEPFQSASVFAQFKVYEHAARQNVKVLLDGQGADEVLAGYHKYFPYYWQELWKQNRKLLRTELEAAGQNGIQESWGWKNRLAAGFPELATRFMKTTRSRQQRKWPGLSKKFVEDYGYSYYSFPVPGSLNNILYYNSFLNGLEELLRFADRNSMAWGREVRLPFLQHELVAFVFSLPSHFKIRNGYSKWILRTAMEQVLPPAIVWRRDKVGFEPPQEEWMKNQQLQEKMVESKRRLVDEQVLDGAELHKKIRPHSSYAADNSDWRNLIAGSWIIN